MFRTLFQRHRSDFYKSQVGMDAGNLLDRALKVQSEPFWR